MKRIIFLLFIITAIFSAAITEFQVNTRSEISEPYPDEVTRVARAIDKAVFDLGYEYSGLGMERLFPPAVFTDEDGNQIIYHQYHSTDPELIKNGEALFFTKIFDPDTAENAQETLVNGEKAMLYEKDSRSYLIWNPNENTILMLNFDPNAVSLEEIIVMAESCR